MVGSPDEYIAAFLAAGLSPVDEEAQIGAVWSDGRVTVVLHLLEEFAGYAFLGGPDDDHDAAEQHRFWSPLEVPAVVAAVRGSV